MKLVVAVGLMSVGAFSLGWSVHSQAHQEKPKIQTVTVVVHAPPKIVIKTVANTVTVTKPLGPTCIRLISDIQVVIKGDSAVLNEAGTIQLALDNVSVAAEENDQQKLNTAEGKLIAALRQMNDAGLGNAELAKELPDRFAQCKKESS